jgi:quinol monooxygenase YgiN
MDRKIVPGNYIVTLTMRVRPAFITRMRVFARELVASAKTEDGCITFLVAESTDTEGHFLIASVWRDKDAYELHRASLYVRAFESQIAPEVLRQSVTTNAWQKLG